MSEIFSLNGAGGVDKIIPKASETVKETVAEVKPQMTEIPKTGLGKDLVSTVGNIKKGDPILEKGIPVLTKSGKAELRLANGTEVLPNIWDPKGGNYTPRHGDIIMYYGDMPKDYGIANPNVLE